ncbi:unnamed protein product [Urochloa humidicola]
MRLLSDMWASALSSEKDKPRWKWEKSGCFSVNSMYANLHWDDVAIPNRKLWKARLPLKIKIFMWLLQSNAILTRDNLIKRNWMGDKRCNFCVADESVQHLFFDCSLARYVWSLVAMTVGADCRPNSIDQFWIWAHRYLPAYKNIHMTSLSAFCWAIWNYRNRIYFEKKRVHSPTEVICSASSFLSYWAGLQKPVDKIAMEQGAEALKESALFFHPCEATQADTGLVLLH